MRRPALPARLALAVLVIAPAALGLGGTTSGTAAGPLPCLGAAARAPGRPCTNPALRTVVTPAPEDALLVPDAPCVPAAPEPGQDANLEVCAFGEPAGRARRTVALLGDSHASHWRAALAVAARTAGWRGLSLTKSSCPFSTADARIAVEAREPCRRHNVAVVAFLARHPEIAAVFVSAHAGARVFTQPGRSHLATKVVGYRGAWAALPASVRRIVVLRDVPVHPLRTTPCVEAALARHADAGTLCAVPRRGALPPDPEVVTAQRAPDPRVSVVDLTPFVCDRSRCFPVVGGVLVNKDTDHLTQAFSASLGPYLLSRTLRPQPLPASAPR